MLTDHLTAARTGDPAAVDAFLAECIPVARRAAASVLGAHHEWLDDAVQEALIKVWRALPRYQDGNVVAWVQRIARNAAIDTLRYLHRFAVDCGEDESATNHQTPHDVMMHRDQTQALYYAISELSEMQRNAVWLVCVEGVKPPQAGEALGMTVKGVYMTVNAGKRTLRRRMGDVDKSVNC